MKHLTKSDFTDWRRADITRVYFEAIQERWYEVLKELAGCELEDVKFRQGYLKALDDVLELDLDFSEESE